MRLTCDDDGADIHGGVAPPPKDAPDEVFRAYGAEEVRRFREAQPTRADLDWDADFRAALSAQGYTLQRFAASIGPAANRKHAREVVRAAKFIADAAAEMRRELRRAADPHTVGFGVGELPKGPPPTLTSLDELDG